MQYLISVYSAIETMNNDSDKNTVMLIYEKYALRVKKYALSILKNEHDANDAVTDVFLKIIHNRHKFDPDNMENCVHLVYLYTKCACIDILRKKQTADCFFTSDVDIDSVASHSTDTSDAVIHGEQKVKLKNAIKSLPELEKQIVYLKYYEGMTNTEIAGLLNINASTVSTKLHRSLKKLRAFMKGNRTNE